jgi:hypothetical protein
VLRRYVHLAAALLAISCLVSLAACTSTGAEEDVEPDMEKVGRALDCPIGFKATCERRVAGRYHCYCFDKDLLRDILDPEKK